VEHEFSGYTVNGIARALDKLGFAAKLKAAASPATREALASGGIFKFHPGATMDEVLVVLCRLEGPDAAAAMMEETTRSSLDGIVAPLARMYLTLKGNEPSVLFERFDDLLRGTARGISAKWTPSGTRSGRLQIAYVGQVDPLVVHGWRGALKYVLQFCHATGEVTADAPGVDGKSVALSITWAAPTK
jgi:hypothetical protein